ncbi:hypothetical protein [Georgenia sp. Marseille-Q6866]
MGEEQAADRTSEMKAVPLWYEALMAEHATVQSRLRESLVTDSYGEEAV